MYGLWTSVLILILTYPGYLVWKPPTDIPYSEFATGLYHGALFLVAQGPALVRTMKTPAGNVIALSTFYWIFFFVAAFIKIRYFKLV